MAKGDLIFRERCRCYRKVVDVCGNEDANEEDSMFCCECGTNLLYDKEEI